MNLCVLLLLAGVTVALTVSYLVIAFQEDLFPNPQFQGLYLTSDMSRKSDEVSASLFGYNVVCSRMGKPTGSRACLSKT